MKINHDSYHQKQLNLQKGRLNVEANEMMNKNYNILYSRLVKSEFDSDIFNDTFIRITAEYQGQDFKELFIKFFKQLKGEYLRNEKMMKYNISPIAEECQTFNSNDIPEEKNEVQKVDIIKDLKEYAIYKKACKKERKRQAQGTTKNISVQNVAKVKKGLSNGEPFMRDLFE